MSTGKTPRPSISGTLPLLLLSVLPPVIPRASWPNTEHMQIPMRRSVCFSSQPQMRNDDTNGIQMPAIDLLNLRLTQQQNSERSGFLNRIKNLFGSRAPSRKTSTASLAPSHIANALKSHMSMLTGILPSTSSSCHVLNSNPPEHEILRRQSFAQSGTAINSTNIEIVEPELIKSRNRRKSMAFTISAHVEKVPDVEIEEIEENENIEPRVNFILPIRRRSSIIHQYSQPTLRERVKGSPRFPHRIVPTSSLNALEDSFKGMYVFFVCMLCSNNNKFIMLRSLLVILTYGNLFFNFISFLHPFFRSLFHLCIFRKKKKHISLRSNCVQKHCVATVTNKYLRQNGNRWRKNHFI